MITYILSAMTALSDKRPHYLIIGAGVAGCSLAYELSKHRVLVTLIDAGGIGEMRCFGSSGSFT